MRTLRSTSVVYALLFVISIGGCLKMDRTLHYLGDSELEYYKQVAQEIDEPCVDESPASNAAETDQPRTLQNRRRDEVRDMSLMEAIHTALANNRIIRSGNSFLSSGNSLYTNANNTSSIYDPSIQESGVLFGGRGLEAALSDFDTTFSTTMLWGRSENVQNNAFFSGGLAPGSTLNTDSGTFRSALQKRFADGGQFIVGHDWDYAGRNTPGQLFPSVYTGNLRAEYRRPLWAASGTEYTRIAGPSNPNFGSITGVSQGVVIARINNDITITNFQMSVRNLVKDVEDLYWELYLAYRLYDTAVVARQSAQESWRVAKVIKDGGGIPNWDAATEPQARSLYFESRAQAETSLNNIYAIELRLRRLLGLKVNDGTVIRPSDEPISAELAPNWQVCLTEALMRRAELRSQKWNIKSLELQLQAAKSLVRPRFDFVSSYQVNAFGDHLFGQNDNDGRTAQGLSSAYESITQGNQTGWTLGFEFSMPLGFRSAQAQVRNYELRLAKAREVLATQELEISHELADAFQNLTRHFANVKSNYERRRAERERVSIYKTREGALATADIVLRAIRDRAQADSAYYSSLVEYTKAVTNLEYRKGTLLDYNHIYLAENEWTPKAYEMALRRARARSAAIDNKLLHTEPLEFVLPHHSGTYCPPGSEAPAGHLVPPPQTDPSLPPTPAPKTTDVLDLPKVEERPAAIQRVGNTDKPKGNQSAKPTAKPSGKPSDTTKASKHPGLQIKSRNPVVPQAKSIWSREKPAKESAGPKPKPKTSVPAKHNAVLMELDEALDWGPPKRRTAPRSFPAAK